MLSGILIIFMAIYIFILRMRIKDREKDWIRALKRGDKHHMTVLELKYIQNLNYIGKYCTWVTEYDGYWAYCRKDGKLIKKTGHNRNTEHTWSSVGNDILKRHNIIEGI